MTFWRFGYHPNSAIDTLLGKDHVKLEELLDEDELLQECKAHNTKLLEYLRDPAVLSQLLRIVIADDLDERQRVKYPFVASEVLSCEIWTICEAMMENTGLLVEFWKFLERPPPLDPLQASYFSKVIGVLLQKKTKEMLQFIKSQPNAVQRIMGHMETSAIMDLLLKLISLEELEEGQGVVDWLADEGLIPTLVGKLEPNLDPEWHGISAQVLLDIIAISQTSSPEQPSIGSNALVQELKGREMLSTLVNYMLDPVAPNSTSSLINGVTIFIELIRRNYCEYDPGTIATLPKPPVDLSELLLVLGDRVEDFQKLLMKPKSVTHPVDSTMGKVIPLGFERLKICELFAELLHCSNMGLLNMKNVPKEQPWREASAVTSQSDPGQVAAAEKHEGGGEKEKMVGEGAFPEGAVEATSTGQRRPSDNKDGPSMICSDEDSNKNEPGGEAFTKMGNAGRDPDQLVTTPVGEILKRKFENGRIIPTCIDLFFTFAWNNFLHTVVYDMIHQILNGRADQGSANRELIFAIFQDAQLTKKITKAQRLCDYEVEQPKGLRIGYMGHVTFIAEEVVNCFECHRDIAEAVQDLSQAEDWLEYTQRTLRETKERDRQPLGGARPATRATDLQALQPDGAGGPGLRTGGDDDEDDEGLEAVAEGDMASDQFARYLCQQITSDLPDKFGSSDDEDEDEDEVSWIGEFDRGSGFDMRAAFGSTSVQDPFNHQRATLDDSFDDSDDSDDNAASWSNNEAPPTMAQFAAEAPQEKLTVADWNADFERSFGRDLDLDGGVVGDSAPKPLNAAANGADASAADPFSSPSSATTADFAGCFESDFGQMKLQESTANTSPAVQTLMEIKATPREAPSAPSASETVSDPVETVKAATDSSEPPATT